MEDGIVIDVCSEIQELSSKNGVRESACYQGLVGSQIVRCPDPLADGNQVGTLSRSQINFLDALASLDLKLSVSQ